MEPIIFYSSMAILYVPTIIPKRNTPALIKTIMFINLLARLTHLASTSDFKYMTLCASCQYPFDAFCKNIFLTPYAAYNKAITGG